jgi:large subunit ribosomal protein L10
MATQLQARQLKAKDIKRMQMDALKDSLKGVRDFVVMSVSGLSCMDDNKHRLALRKKGIRLQMVKNSLARRVFSEMGMEIDGIWTQSTTLAWGGTSIAGLSKELETTFKPAGDKVKFKGAIADGQLVTFQQALKMPTREEAIGRVIMLALSPASRIAGALKGPAGRVAGQIKSIAEKKEEAPAAQAT